MPRRDRRRVAIVEDNEDIALLLNLRLARLGHLVVATWTESFAALLGRRPWEQTRPDVAVVDILLGEETDGLGILRFLAAEFPEIERAVYSGVPVAYRRELEGLIEPGRVVQIPGTDREIEAAVSGGKRRS